MYLCLGIPRMMQHLLGSSSSPLANPPYAGRISCSMASWRKHPHPSRNQSKGVTAPRPFLKHRFRRHRCLRMDGLRGWRWRRRELRRRRPRAGGLRAAAASQSCKADLSVGWLPPAFPYPLGRPRGLRRHHGPRPRHGLRQHHGLRRHGLGTPMNVGGRMGCRSRMRPGAPHGVPRRH